MKFLENGSRPQPPTSPPNYAELLSLANWLPRLLSLVRAHASLFFYLLIFSHCRFLFLPFSHSDFSLCVCPEHACVYVVYVCVCMRECRWRERLFVWHTRIDLWFSNADYTTLQHIATHCNTLQHIATHCNTLQHTATHCNILQHTATHLNTLQHTATQNNELYVTCH